MMFPIIDNPRITVMNFPNPPTPPDLKGLNRKVLQYLNHRLKTMLECLVLKLRMLLQPSSKDRMIGRIQNRLRRIRKVRRLQERDRETHLRLIPPRRLRIQQLKGGKEERERRKSISLSLSRRCLHKMRSIIQLTD